MTIIALLFFVALMAIGGLALDMGRLYSLQGQIQTYVDNAALAGASQLDGQSNAICRAVDAIIGPTVANTCATPSKLVTGQQYFAAGTSQLSVLRLTFLSSLGADPGARGATPAAGDVVECTLDPPFTVTAAACNAAVIPDAAARFVEVRSNPETMSFFILPVMKVVTGGAVGAQTLYLKATAGYKSQFCDTTPMMICNPTEPTTNTDTNYPFTAISGEQILMKAGGAGSWAPGDFGWLNPPANAGGSECGGGGSQQVECMLALVNPLTQCFDFTGVGMQPGSATSTANGLNVRFDIYNASLGTGQTSSDPNFAPSVNVAKGICKLSGSNCNYNGNAACPNWSQETQDTQSSTQALIPFPRDSNIFADQDAGTVRFGNTTWAISRPTLCPGAATGQQCYWQINHGGTIPGSLATATRYQVYRYEIDNGLIPNKSGGSGENGNPKCNSSGINDSGRDRRTLILSVVNCHAWGISGNSVKNVTVVALMQMFLTEPVGLSYQGIPGNLNNVYGEVVGTIKPGDKTGVLHQFPVLYR